MYSENLVQRNFDPDSLNAVSAVDITYVKAALGWMYLAVVELSTVACSTVAWATARCSRRTG